MNLARVGQTDVFEAVYKICVVNAKVSELVDVGVAPDFSAKV